MFFERRTIPGLAIHTYIVGDEETKQCVVIDPVRDVEPYIEIAESNGIAIRHILETHVHADFISGALELKMRLKGMPTIHCSGMGGEEWIPSYADHIVSEGDTFKVGSLTFTALHTPGHTPEHMTWVVEENGKILKLFSGDFLFVGSVGRPDLLGKESIRQLSGHLYNSVFEKLAPYPDDASVHPAHGAGSLCGKEMGRSPSSTLGEERMNNPFLRPMSEEAWVEELLKNMPSAPKYFARLKKINVNGAPLIGEEKPGSHPLSPEQIRIEGEAAVIVVDTRSKEAFAASHIPHSINLPLSPQFSTWAAWVINSESPLVLLVEEKSQLEIAATALLRVGLDRIIGHLDGGMDAWKNGGLKTMALRTMTPETLNHRILKGDKVLVVDVRTGPEWSAGRIENAVHLPLSSIADRLNELPKNHPLALICGSGSRSSAAASLLLREGFMDVTNIVGGMSEWKGKGLPTVNA